ncbi:MAG TPA: hypothetical protein H9694_02745 [Firmicutes bacterium]|nr:hypothetical protein [Bacillota bacterium]
MDFFEVIFAAVLEFFLDTLPAPRINSSKRWAKGVNIFLGIAWALFLCAVFCALLLALGYGAICVARLFF